MNNRSLVIGAQKSWLKNQWDNLRPGVNYAINGARLDRDRRDFVIQSGDTGES